MFFIYKIIIIYISQSLIQLLSTLICIQNKVYGPKLRKIADFIT